MENALREELVPTNKTTVERVLILVIMDNALREVFTNMLVGIDIGLNPCYNG